MKEKHTTERAVCQRHKCFAETDRQKDRERESGKEKNARIRDVVKESGAQALNRMEKGNENKTKNIRAMQIVIKLKAAVAAALTVAHSWH